MQPYLNQMNSILTELFVEYARVYRAPGILLSGGIDSSMISYFVSSNFKEYTILSMGTEKTKDKKYIDIMSDYLKKPYIWIDITEQNLATDITVIKQLLKNEGVEINIMQVSLAAGYFTIFKKVLLI